jgi:hypothetical protein
MLLRRMAVDIPQDLTADHEVLAVSRVDELDEQLAKGLHGVVQGGGLWES